MCHSKMSKQKSQRGDVTRDVNDVMHRKRARRILEDLKKFSSWELDSEQEGSTFEACWGQTNLCATGTARDGGGGDGKVIIERLCISLPYVETFNSKVMKGFAPELRSRYVFFVFRDSYVLSIYIMNILCTFHISVSWICYTDWTGATCYLMYLCHIKGSDYLKKSKVYSLLSKEMKMQKIYKKNAIKKC